MQFWKITPAERAAKHFGQRKTDKVAVEVWTAGLVGRAGPELLGRRPWHRTDPDGRG